MSGTLDELQSHISNVLDKSIVFGRQFKGALTLARSLHVGMDEPSPERALFYKLAAPPEWHGKYGIRGKILNSATKKCPSPINIVYITGSLL